MARRREAKSSTPSSQTAKPTPDKPLVEIPEDEQWRIINQSGILKSVEGSEVEDDADEPTPLGEEIFNSLLLIIPFSFLLLMMEILIHHQYRQSVSLQAVADRMISGVPILSLFIFYSGVKSVFLEARTTAENLSPATRYKQHRSMQLFLFLLSFFVSARMLYVINRRSWMVNMKQDPPLATLWIYTIVQLDLGPAVLSLLTTGSFIWWKGLKLSF